MKGTRIRAYPRLHVTLLDTPRRTAFSPGGLGFSVCTNPLELIAEESESLLMEGFQYLGELVRQQCELVARRTLGQIRRSGARLRLIALPPQHRGYGSKTLLLSGIVNVLSSLWGVTMTLPVRQQLTGRGGTSGVGLHTFYEGGLVLDAGRLNAAQVEMLPSSAVKPDSLPLKIGRWDMPHYSILLVEVEGHAHSGEREVAIFRQHANFSEEELGRLLAYVHNGFIPAALTANFSVLARALRGIHLNGFKAAELNSQSVEVRETYGALAASGFACGLSSMGPLVYVMVSPSDAGLAAAAISKLRHISSITATTEWNSGFAVESG